MSKKGSLGGIEILGLILVSSLLLHLMTSSDSGITGNFIYADLNCNPPASGDWIISSDVNCVGENITITGNIIVNGTNQLVIEGSNFTINNESTKYIYFYNNSRFIILNSTLDILNENWFIEMHDESSANFSDSFFKDGIGFKFTDNSTNYVKSLNLSHNSYTEGNSVNYFEDLIFKNDLIANQAFDLTGNSNTTFIDSFIDVKTTIRNNKNIFINTIFNNESWFQQFPQNYFTNSTINYIYLISNSPELFGNFSILDISTLIAPTALINRSYPIYLTYNNTDIPVANRQVNITNSSGTVIWQGITDSNGYVEAVITYVAATASGNKYNDNYTISTNEIQDFGLLKSTPIELNVQTMETLNITCSNNSIEHINCSDINYGDTITNITVKCTGAGVNNVSFTLYNLQDNTIYYSSTNYNQNGDYYSIAPNYQILDSGNWTINTTCIGSTNASTIVEFYLPFGTLTPQLIDPNTNTNVTKNQFFTFKSKVTCVGGECNNITATLDPIKN